MAPAFSDSPSDVRATRLERVVLGLLGAFMPRPVRHRQLKDWDDFLQETRHEGGSVPRELAQFARATPVIAWRAGPPALRAGLAPLVLAATTAVLLWPGQPTPAPDLGFPSLTVERAITWAEAQRGSKAYSGWNLRFVTHAFGESIIPAATAAIAANQFGPRERNRPVAAAPTGSLLWFEWGDPHLGSDTGHVGISLGDGRMISALDSVRIDRVDGSRYWTSRYLGWSPAPSLWPGRSAPGTYVSASPSRIAARWEPSRQWCLRAWAVSVRVHDSHCIRTISAG